MMDRFNPVTVPDGELLTQFLEHRDEAAFAVLVHRYGGMVLGTCRRVLGNATDAEDAFQATFVVLVRKAHGLTGRACIGNYLYGIAFHTARKAKSMAAKRRIREVQTPTTVTAATEPGQSELLAALDEELARLPEKYRAPVVLCELEGRSRREAAGALSVAEGTISSRLAAAHRMLEKRLRERGFTGVVLAAVLAGPRVASAVTADAVRAVAHPSQAVSQLASEVTKMHFLYKLGLSATAFAVVVGVAVAAGDVVPHGNRAEPPNPTPAAAGKSVEPKPKPKPESAWKTEFRKVYGLKDGELVRRVAPPYPECRAEYFKDRTREHFKWLKMAPPEAELKKDYTDHYTKFGWKDGWTDPNLITQMVPVQPDTGVGLDGLLRATIGFPATRMRFDAFADANETNVTGDWVVRDGADPDKLVAALEQILRKECGLKVSLAFKDEEREVYVLSGKYVAKPLPGRKENEIEIYAVELSEANGGLGNANNPRDLARAIEGWIEVPIELGTIEGAPKRMTFRINVRTPTTVVSNAEDKDPTKVLENFAAQTGLTAKKEKRKIKVLVVKKDS